MNARDILGKNRFGEGPVVPKYSVKPTDSNKPKESTTKTKESTTKPKQEAGAEPKPVETKPTEVKPEASSNPSTKSKKKLSKKAKILMGVLIPVGTAGLITAIAVPLAAKGCSSSSSISSYIVTEEEFYKAITYLYTEPGNADYTCQLNSTGTVSGGATYRMKNGKQHVYSQLTSSDTYFYVPNRSQKWQYNKNDQKWESPSEQTVDELMYNALEPYSYSYRMFKLNGNVYQYEDHQQQSEYEYITRIQFCFTRINGQPRVQSLNEYFEYISGGISTIDSVYYQFSNYGVTDMSDYPQTPLPVNKQ